MKKFLLAALATLVLIPAQAQLVHSTTITKVKQPRKTLWYVRAGVSMNNATGSFVSETKDYWEDHEIDASFGIKPGYDFEVGMQKPLGSSGVYYNLALAFGTAGYKTTTNYEYTNDYPGYNYTKKVTQTSSLLLYDVKLMPLAFGYKYAVTPDIKLDAHLGFYIGYTLSGTVKDVTDTYTNDNGKIQNNTDKNEPDFEDFKKENDFCDGDAGMQLGLGVWFKKFNLDFTWQRGFVNRYGYLADLDDPQSLCTSNFMIRLGIGF